MAVLKRLRALQFCFDVLSFWPNALKTPHSQTPQELLHTTIAYNFGNSRNHCWGGGAKNHVADVKNANTLFTSIVKGILKLSSNCIWIPSRSWNVWLLYHLLSSTTHLANPCLIFSISFICQTVSYGTFLVTSGSPQPKSRYQKVHVSTMM